MNDTEARLRALEERALNQRMFEIHSAWTLQHGPPGITGVYPYNTPFTALVPQIVPLPLDGVLAARRLIASIGRTTVDAARATFAIYRSTTTMAVPVVLPPGNPDAGVGTRPGRRGALRLVRDCGAVDASAGRVSVDFEQAMLNPWRAMYFVAICASDSDVRFNAPVQGPVAQGWTGNALGASMAWPRELELARGALFQPSVGIFSARGVLATGG